MKPIWRELIDKVHDKHLKNIQADGVGGLAYHYTSPAGLLGIVSNESIWLSDSDYLNDVSESDYFFSLASKMFSSNKTQKAAKNLAFRSYMMSLFHCNDSGRGRETTTRERERRYVFSLSLDEDALSLWNYYTKTSDATGYNIGINLEKFIDSIELTHNQTILFGRVEYNREYQEELLSELYNDYFDIYVKYPNSYQRKYLYEALEDNITKYSIFMKSDSFKSESEYRVAVFEKGITRGTRKYRNKNGAFLPYIEKQIDKDSVSSIMISPTTRADFVKSSVIDLCENYELKGITIKRSSIPIRY